MQAGIEDIIVFISTHHQHNDCQQQLLVQERAFKACRRTCLPVECVELSIDQKRHSNERFTADLGEHAAR